MSTFDLPHGVVGFTPILLGGCRCYPGRLEQGEGQRTHRNGSQYRGGIKSMNH